MKKSFLNTKLFNIVISLVLFITIALLSIAQVEANNTTSATLLSGSDLSQKMKTIANGGVSVAAGSANTNVYAIKKSNLKKDGLTAINVISTNDSDYAVYMWYEDNTLFFYSDADKIYLNGNSSYAFKNFSNLTDISGFQYFDASRVSNLGRFFQDTVNLTDLSPLANWDVSNISDMTFAFGANYTGSSGTPMKLSDLSPLANWDVSNVTTMNQMFKGCTSLKTLESIKNWDVSSVTDMQQMFNRSGLTDASAIKNWDVSAVTNFNMMLANIPGTSTRPIFTYRAGTWSSNGTYTPKAKRDVTITINWPPGANTPNTVILHFKRDGETSELISKSGKFQKNGNVWTYVFAVYDSATYYVWEEDIDNYDIDAPQSSPKKIVNNAATITNTFKSYDITLKNTITGNLASINDEFEYTITLYNAVGTPLSGTVKINNSENITLSNGSFTKKLKDNEQLIINDILYDYRYKIVEKDTEYTESYKIDNGAAIEGNATNVLIVSKDHQIVFNNFKDAAVKTGIVADSFPFVLLAIIGSFGLIILKCFQKRKILKEL